MTYDGHSVLVMSELALQPGLPVPSGLFARHHSGFLFLVGIVLSFSVKGVSLEVASHRACEILPGRLPCCQAPLAELSGRLAQ